MKTNGIKEIYPGHYYTLLDFPDVELLSNLLDPDYKYVWLFDHNEIGAVWEPYTRPLHSFGKNSTKCQARRANMELLIDTQDFKRIIPDLHSRVKLVQVDKMPPTFLDLSKLKGKSRYDLLARETNYLFEIEIPIPHDHSPLVSTQIDIIEKAILFTQKSNKL